MPQTPGGGTGGDPQQARMIRQALAQAGYNVPLSWIETQMENGATASQIIQRAQQRFEQEGDGDGGDEDLQEFLEGLGQDEGSGGSGGSSGGSGGSGMSAEDRARMEAQMRANYVEILRRWGLSPGQSGLENLIEHGVNAEWSTTQFIQAVRKTKAYHQMFPGIRWREGMTEGEYNRMYGAYREMSGNIGFKLNRSQFGILVRKQVTASEFKLRVEALDRIKTYRPLLNEFEEVLRARGLLKGAAGKNGQLTTKELYRFVIKQGDPRWEQIWQESVVRQGLEDAGLTIGRRGDFSRRELLQLIRQVDTPRSEVENLSIQDFQKLATNIKEVMPLSELYGKGVTKKDLAVLALGGKGAPRIAERVQEILAQRNLESEDRAAPQLVQTQTGSTVNYGGLAGESTQ